MSEKAIELIKAERERQKSAEGWTEEHDDSHKAGQLARAAACYMVGEDLPVYRGTLNGVGFEDAPRILRLWPWDKHWLKLTPRDRIRELVKGAALAAAEIERLQRIAAKTNPTK